MVSSVRGFRPTLSRPRRRGAILQLAAHHVHGHPATRRPAPPALTSPVASAGFALARARGNLITSWGPRPSYWRHHPRLVTKRRKAYSTQGGGKGMKNAKQVMKKPYNKVGGQDKGRKEEGKGGEPTVPCRQRLPPSFGAARLVEGIYREVRFGTSPRALGTRGISPLEGVIKTCLRAHAFGLSI
jgi:hypothetical protein